MGIKSGDQSAIFAAYENLGSLTSQPKLHRGIHANNFSTSSVVKILECREGCVDFETSTSRYRMTKLDKAANKNVFVHSINSLKHNGGDLEKRLYASKLEGQETLSCQSYGDLLKKHALSSLLPFHFVLTRQDSSRVFLTDIFESSSGRNNCIAAYEQKGETHMLYLYKSNSQGTWRLMPSFNDESRWLGKGYSEESTVLPIDIQKSIIKLENFTSKIPLNSSQMSTLRLAICPHQAYTKEDKPLSEHTKNTHPYFSQVQKTPGCIVRSPDKESVKKSESYQGKRMLSYIEPHELRLEEGLEPDFNHLLDTFEYKSALYGDITSYVFASCNNACIYAFNVSSDNKVWIGQIDSIKSQSSNAVCYKNWVIGNPSKELSMGLLTPPYEYPTQAPKKYSDTKDMNQGYVSTVKYLNNIPVIKRFKKALKNMK